MCVCVCVCRGGRGQFLSDILTTNSPFIYIIILYSLGTGCQGGEKIEVIIITEIEAVSSYSVH